MEMEMATHSSILAWRIPPAEEPIVHGVARVGHDLATQLLLLLLCINQAHV